MFKVCNSILSTRDGPKIALATWSVAEVAAEVAGRLGWTEPNVLNKFMTFGIDGHMVATCDDFFFQRLFHEEHERARTLPFDPDSRELDCMELLLHAYSALRTMQEEIQAIALMRAPALECSYDDRFLGKSLRITADKRADIRAPLCAIAIAATSLKLQKPSRSGYTRVSLWPAQLQRAAIGFTVKASDKLASVGQDKTWRKCILNRVIGGLAGKIQVFYMRA
jgi:hypothetical protein